MRRVTTDDPARAFDSGQSTHTDGQELRLANDSFAETDMATVRSADKTSAVVEVPIELRTRTGGRDVRDLLRLCAVTGRSYLHPASAHLPIDATADFLDLHLYRGCRHGVHARDKNVPFAVDQRVVELGGRERPKLVGEKG